MSQGSTVSPMERPKPSFRIDVPRGEDKFKELVLYISHRCQNDPFFGAVKLNKILWRSDFLAYLRLGQPITGVVYRKLRNGPVPRRFPVAHEALVREGRVRLEQRPTVGDRPRKVSVPLDDPNLDLFNGAEISIVHEAISEFADLNATEASDKSHGIAWSLAQDGENIPYEAVFLAEPDIYDGLMAGYLLEENEKGNVGECIE